MSFGIDYGGQAAHEWEQFHTPKNLAMALAAEVENSSNTSNG